MDLIRSILNREINPTNWSPSSITTDLSNKVFIVTGGNAGLGYQTVLELAKRSPQRIYLTARSRSKYDTALSKLRQDVPNAESFVSFVELDLASLASVKQAAEAILSASDRLDVLINNAGVMGSLVGLTSEGYENHFGTNHMGHALFVKLLMPLLLRTAEQPGSDVRIVNVSSFGHMSAPWSGFDPALVMTDMGNAQMMTRYGQSKLANILHARELARRYPSITSVSVHPGRVATGLLDDMYATGRNGAYGYFQKFYDWTVTPMTEERGALTQLWCATIPKEELESGAYYVPIGTLNCGSSSSRDEALIQKLWDWQEAEFARLGYA